MQSIDNGDEIIKPNDTFKLKTGTHVPRPNNVSLDSSDHGQADDYAVTASKILRIVYHETMGRKIADVQL